MSPFRLFSLMFILSVPVLSVFGQRTQDWFQLGERALSENDPYGALRYFGEVMEMDSAKALHNYKYAEALRLNHQYSKAAFYYSKVYRRDLGLVFPEGLTWLATMQKQSGDYPEAKSTWRRVREQNDSKPEGYNYRKAVQEMRACDLAGQWSAEPTPFELQLLPAPVNTESSEFAGFFLDDGRLIFTALLGQFDEEGRLESDAATYVAKLYEADSAGAKISPKTFLESEKYMEANFSLNGDASKAAFTSIGENGRTVIFLIDLSMPNQLAKQMLALGGESEVSNFTQPAFGILDGEEVLFFSSDCEGGFGQYDIWYIPVSRKGAIKQNAGPEINSPGNEITPFLRENGTFYFASDWHHGFGGFDLFSAERREGHFSIPQNLKKPFNSPSNDLYYSFNSEIGKGTISSNRKSAMHYEQEGCCNDLWLFAEAQTLEAEALPTIENLEDLNAYLPVKLYFHNDEPDPRTTDSRTGKNYLDTYYRYITLLSDYESAYRKGLNDEDAEMAEEAMDQFFLTEVDAGIADLELFARLLLLELEEGQRINVTVKGFASPLANTDYNVKLTSRRISSLINYLSEYEGGIFQPFLEQKAANGGQLHITEIPFGEYTSGSVVSDNPNDKSKAVYSIAAARERKIEIVSVQRAQNDTSVAEVIFDSEIADLGSVSSIDSLYFQFDFLVESGALLEIDSLEFDQSRISLNAVERSYGLGFSGMINGFILPGLPLGKHNFTITFFGNISDRRRELNIALEVK